MEEKPIMFIPADKSYIQILDYKIEGYKDFETFIEDLQRFKNDEVKKFYNQQINELYNIIEQKDEIINDYISLVSSMRKTIQLFDHRLNVADQYLESRKENLCVDHYNDLKYIVNECDLESTKHLVIELNKERDVYVKK